MQTQTKSTRKAKAVPTCSECGGITSPLNLHRGVCALCKLQHQPGKPYPEPCGYFNICGNADNGRGNECCDRCEQSILETGDIS